MTLAVLRYIVAIARKRLFGRAAETCFVSQGTMSVTLEREGGAKPVCVAEFLSRRYG